MQVYAVFGLFLLGLALLALAWNRAPGARAYVAIAFGILSAGIAVFLWIVSEPQLFLSDFHKAYYNAGRVVHRDPEGLYDADPLEFVNLPLVGYLFTPLTWLPRKVAGGIITILGVAAILSSLLLLARLGRLDGQRVMLLAVLFLVCGPLYNSLREGNATHFVLFGLVAVLFLADEVRPVPAGIILACCVIMKPPLGYLVLPFILYRQWPAVGSFAGTLAAFGTISLLVLGWGPHERWYERVVEPYQQHPLGAFNVQSVDGFVARLLEGGAYLTDWMPIDDIHGAFAPFRYAIVLGVLASTALVFWFARRSRSDDAFLHDMSILLVLSMIVGPITWTHYYSQMLIPLALIIGGRIQVPEGRVWTAVVALIVVLSSLPVIQIDPARAPLDEIVPRLFISHYFYAGVLMLGLLLVSRLRVAKQSEAEPSRVEQLIAQPA